MPVLLVGTYRSDFELPIQPRSSATSIAISRLAAPEIEALTLQVAGEASLPRPVLDHIIYGRGQAGQAGQCLRLRRLLPRLWANARTHGPPN